MYCIYSEPPEYIIDQNNNICLICWNSDELNDKVTYLKNFPNFISLCNCNALFHNNCLHTWIIKSPSCPICRKELTLFVSVQHYYCNLGINYCIVVIKRVQKMLSFFVLISSLNIIIICVSTLVFGYINLRDVERSVEE
jgi:hypothetical protein